MPKSSPIQTNFSGGELGPLVEGRVDAEKHATGVEILQNYIPMLEGPIVRTPGTKRVAPVKDPSKPPRFIPFKISNKEQYIIEAGENYFRFFTDEGQLVTNGSSYAIYGFQALGNSYYRDGGVSLPPATPIFRGIRSRVEFKTNELNNQFVTVAFSSLVSGTKVEVATVWDYDQIKNVGYAQKGDTLWIYHSSLPTYTLQRFGPQDWDLKYFQTKDGPYLPLNSHITDADQARFGFNIEWEKTENIATFPKKAFNAKLIAHSSVKVANVVYNNGNFEVRTSGNHPFIENDNVWVTGVVGPTEVNNGTSVVTSSWSVNPTTTESSVWSVRVISSTSIVLRNSIWNSGVTIPYVGSGVVYPSIFNAFDSGRNIGLYIDGHRYSGVLAINSSLVIPNIPEVHNIAAEIAFDLEQESIPVASTIVKIWQMGAHNKYHGFPSAGAFHQSRHVMTGVPLRPIEFVASETREYQSFAVSNASSLAVIDTNALQFDLVSDSNDLLQWVKPSVQGLYFGSNNAEHLVSPSKEGQALTPTNINNDIIGNYGSANVNPVRFGDSVIYLQNAQRKVRELRFFANLQSHKSTQLNQISDHIGYPEILGMATQKETYPLVWGYRSDGKLISMSYAREDSQAISGWASHQLGGRSDSAGTAPKIKAIEVIRDSTGKYDQLWMAVQRFINGTSTVEVEYMVEPYRHGDPTQKQRDAYYVSCGATYDSSLVISNITTGSALITVTNHGLNRNDLVLISDVVGLNSSLININGVVVGSNIVNDRVFVVGSTTTNNFFLQDFNSSIIVTATYSPYFSGGKARKLVSQVGGLTWLKNEEVDILGDGAIQGKATVNSAGVVVLTVPAAVVQIGYAYKSRVKTLVKEQGSATGSAVGQMRKTYQAAFKVKDVGDFAYGGIDFNNMHRANFAEGDLQQTDALTPLYTGIYRDGLEQDVGLYGQVYFEQNSPLPGMIQSITYLMDEYDL